MSELTDLIITVVDGNDALAVLLLGLFLIEGWQIRYFGAEFDDTHDRIDDVRDRVRRTESYLIAGSDVATDGGRKIGDPEEVDDDDT